jgi:hypothetical protein
VRAHTSSNTPPAAFCVRHMSFLHIQRGRGKVSSFRKAIRAVPSQSVQPIFLAKRPGHARCYVCHSIGTPFRLQRLSPGATTWNDEQSRRNYEAAQQEVVPGNPQASHLLQPNILAR